MKDKHFLFFGYLGLLATVMVGIGEFLIHFTYAELDETVRFSYLLGTAQSRFTIGHFLMVPFIPLYVFGYWHLYLALKPGNDRLATAVLVLGIFAFMIGGMWVASRAHLGAMVQALHESDTPALAETLFASYDLHIESLVQILRVLILLISVCFVWAILGGGTLYPKWMAFFNPILLLMIVFALFFFVHPIGQFLAPTAMNVAHFTLFSASLLALRISGKKEVG